MRRTGLYARVVCVKKPNERGTSEWGLLTKTTSAYNSVQSNFYDVSCLLHVTREFSLKWFSKHKFKTKTHALIFSISLSSFVETKSFFGNETSLCDLLDVLLFSWCHTNTSGQQPTDTNLELSSAFAGTFEGGAAKKSFQNLERYLNVSDERFRLASKGRYAIVDWLYFHMWKQLYAIPIGCIGFFHMWKYST